MKVLEFFLLQNVIKSNVVGPVISQIEKMSEAKMQTFPFLSRQLKLGTAILIIYE